jgi:hypothetical protein
MTPAIVLALVFALASATLVNTAYLREHAAARRLPRLSPRRPLAAVRTLLGDRAWLGAFAMETGGFAFYVAALDLAPLALVQSVGAGGIGLLAIGSARIGRRRLTTREGVGTVVAILGLLLLALSLIDGGTSGARGSALAIAVWLAATAAIAVAVLAGAPRLLGSSATCGIAGGLLFAIGDISTKVATQGGSRVVFAATLVAGYALGTSLCRSATSRAPRCRWRGSRRC